MSTTKIRILFFCVIVLFFASCVPKKISSNSKNNSANTEILYHVFQRSFYDSNGDEIGDLNGLREKLDYLQDLGVTSIQLLPLYQSPFYHNYFSDDFYKIDSTLATFNDYISLVKEVHHRSMKIYMDMETQYVTEDHPWYRDSYNNLKSPYSNYLVWADSAHTQTEKIVMNVTELKGYNGVVKKLIMVNLDNPAILDYNIKLYSYWLDPNKDGKFDDGVDGFRFDHMMDDLDNRHRVTNTFEKFWKPLIIAIKKVNPKIINVAEQAEWGSWPADYITKAGVDRVYSFKLMGGIRSFNKKYLTLMADSAFHVFPKGNHQIIFIENHDLPRFANQVNEFLPKLKIAAALNLLLGQTPSIYYGQELGMNGKGEWQKWGMTDANEIPDREAFEWYKSDTGKGMALWYKNSGPWWDNRYSKPNDGISLEEEKPDTNSIYNFYKKMIAIRKNNPVISTGSYQTLVNTNDQVFAYQRYDSLNRIIVLINYADSPQATEVTLQNVDPKNKNVQLLHGTVFPVFSENKFSMKMPPYGIEVIKITAH
jgi:glycosidase